MIIYRYCKYNRRWGYDRREEKEMSKTKHTPGPWDFIDGHTLIHIETHIDNPAGAGMPICSVPKTSTGRANARLIANAPDLLEALVKIAALSRSTDRRPDDYGDITRDAISEVEGCHD
jgi:hypothetical protein